MYSDFYKIIIGFAVKNFVSRNFSSFSMHANKMIKLTDVL